MPTPVTKAVLFDLDGTLIDTHEFIRAGFDHALRLHGHTGVAHEDMVPVAGFDLKACFNHFLPEVEDCAQLITDLRAFQAVNLHLVTTFSHTLSTLHAVRERSIKIAVITNRTRSSAVVSLEKTNLFNQIDLLVSPEDVKNVKPHPEGVLKALDHFGVSADEAWMIGDSDVDITAGKNGGVRTIGVMSGPQGELLLQHAPNYVIKDIQDILQYI